MARQLSQPAFRAIFGQETSEAFLVLLTLSHPSLSQPIRVTSDGVHTTSRGLTFYRYPFEITLADDTDGSIRDVTLSIDAVDLSIIEAVRRISGPELMVTMEVVLASSPDLVEVGPVEFTMRSVQYDASKVEGTLVFEDVLNEAYPGESYGPGNYPALF